MVSSKRCCPACVIQHKDCNSFPNSGIEFHIVLAPDYTSVWRRWPFNDPGNHGREKRQDNPLLCYGKMLLDFRVFCVSPGMRFAQRGSSLLIRLGVDFYPRKPFCAGLCRPLRQIEIDLLARPYRRPNEKACERHFNTNLGPGFCTLLDMERTRICCADC